MLSSSICFYCCYFPFSPSVFLCAFVFVFDRTCVLCACACVCVCVCVRVSLPLTGPLYIYICLSLCISNQYSCVTESARYTFTDSPVQGIQTLLRSRPRRYPTPLSLVSQVIHILTLFHCLYLQHIFPGVSGALGGRGGGGCCWADWLICSHSSVSPCFASYNK